MRILLVGINLADLESLSILLKDLGHDVRMAISAESAMEVARIFQPQAAFVDLGLPYGGSRELAGLLKSQFPDLLLYAMADASRPGHRDRAAAGFDAELSKPVDLALVRALLGPRHS